MPITEIDVVVSGLIYFSKNSEETSNARLDIRKKFVCDHQGNIVEQPLDFLVQSNANETDNFISNLRAHDFASDDLYVSGTIYIQINNELTNYPFDTVAGLMKALDAIDQIMPRIEQLVMVHQQSQAILKHYENVSPLPSPTLVKKFNFDVQTTESTTQNTQQRKRIRHSQDLW